MVKLRCTLVEDPSPNMLSASLTDAKGAAVSISILDSVMTTNSPAHHTKRMFKTFNLRNSFNLRSWKLSPLENVT
jgi:hypothetical protein